MTRSEDRASTLLFFPATLLVMVVLAAITVDFARLHLAQRQVDDLAAATANDAVTVGLDVPGLRTSGQYHLAPGRIRSVAEAHADHAPLPVAVAAQVTDPHSVAVTVSAPVPLAFSRALPGVPPRVTVRADARATARLR